MELIDCPHCGGTVNAIFELCPKCGKGLRRDWSSEIAAVNARAKAKEDKASRESPANVRAQNWGCLGLAAIIIALVASVGITGLVNNSAKQEAAAKKEAALTAAKFSGYCPGLLASVYEVTSVLGGAGDTSTVEDVRATLKKNAELFVGYANLVKNPDQAAVIRDASEEMYQLRVVLTDGGDYKKPAMWLKSNLITIESVCNG